MDYSANSSGTLHNLIFILEYNFILTFGCGCFYQNLWYSGMIFYECEYAGASGRERPLSFVNTQRANPSIKTVSRFFEYKTWTEQIWRTEIIENGNAFFHWQGHDRKTDIGIPLLTIC